MTASAWLNDLRNQIERTRILSTVYRSASALGSRLPSIASAKAKVAGAGAILRPVSDGTQVSHFLCTKRHASETTPCSEPFCDQTSCNASVGINITDLLS